MSFKDWINSSYPNPVINGRWGLLHISMLVLSIAIILVLTLLFRKKSEKSRKIVLFVIIGIILFFELARRIINICKTTEFTLDHTLYILLPRPWCAISTWSFILLLFVKKQWLYNFTCFTSMLCALVFFAYPGVGFNNQYILFENLYSIAAHMLLLIGSICLITLKFTKFEYKNMWKEVAYLVFIFAYALFEIFVLKIEPDPLMFMANNDVQAVLGISYGWYLAIYIIFITIYINVFYLIEDRKKVFKKIKFKK